MSPVRRLQVLLWTTAALCALGAVLVIASVKLWPVKAPQAANAPAPSVTAVGTNAPALPKLASFEPVLRMNLRSPLIDAPETQPTSPEPAVKPSIGMPGLRLIGTAVEPGNSFGIFLSGLNTIEVRAVGQKTVGGAEVLQINEKSARVRQGGQVTTLPLADRTEAPTTAPSGAALIEQILERQRQAQEQRQSAPRANRDRPAAQGRGRAARGEPRQDPDEDDEEP